MKDKWPALLFLIFSYTVSAQTNYILRPFPQHTKYFPGTIKSNNASQAQLDAQVLDFYIQWKKRFVKTIPGKQQSYVSFENIDNKQCVSEGQGYGMIITAFMAGKNDNAKEIYDNMFRYCRAHPTAKSRYLMAWAQSKTGKDLDKTSATDGDMDIAWSLLIADKQWGSNGAINYLQEARDMLADVMKYEINQKTWSVLLSDAVEYDSKDYYAMRSSDFMPAHFKAFKQVTNDERWGKVIVANYKLFISLQNKYSPEAGLLPDFIVNINKQAKPAPANFLESKYDGYYNYNACRIPWRIATDYLLTGDDHAKTITNKINRWIRETSANKPDNISAGYTLNGDDIKGRNFEALSFITPFAVSAMVDTKNQQWLDNLWNYLTAFNLKDFDYYDNTVKLLNMIIISGNYYNY